MNENKALPTLQIHKYQKCAHSDKAVTLLVLDRML